MTKAMSIRVLLVDDHPTIRESLRSVLRAYPNIEVIGEAKDGQEALARVENLQPAVVVMDINMTRMDGVTATRLIKEQYPKIAVIGLSVEHKDYQVYAMQKAGALEVISKQRAAVDLYDAIQRGLAFVQPALISEETLSKQAI